ncbi:PrgI family mobile element protein [Bacillus swezeyi]
MSSEQKTILGVLSKRQLIYLIGGGALIYSYIPFVFNLFPNFFIALIACMGSALPVAALTCLLAFLKKESLHLNYDHYLLIKHQYKTQIGVWRKGKTPKEWMMSND